MTREDAIKEIELAKKENRSANFRHANFSHADLGYADLGYADLSHASLRSADLGYADLRYASLRSADLRHADLSHASLRSADLGYADLRSADLGYADLRYASLPSPTMVLLAIWGELSDELTLEGMRYDAFNHPDPYAFDRWADGGHCPYSGIKIQRAFNFKEKRSLWTPWNPRKKVLSAYELMKRVIIEKCSDSDFHKKEQGK